MQGGSGDDTFFITVGGDGDVLSGTTGDSTYVVMNDIG